MSDDADAALTADVQAWLARHWSPDMAGPCAVPRSPAPGSMARPPPPPAAPTATSASPSSASAPKAAAT